MSCSRALTFENCSFRQSCTCCVCVASVLLMCCLCVANVLLFQAKLDILQSKLLNQAAHTHKGSAHNLEKVSTKA